MDRRPNPLTASNIKYLIVLQALDESNGVRCTDAATMLRVTKPSVNKMMNSLKNMDLIEQERYGMVRFTPAGRVLADQYSQCFQVLCRHFGSLLPPEADLKTAVCTLLSSLSIEDAEMMCRNIEVRA